MCSMSPSKLKGCHSALMQTLPFLPQLIDSLLGLTGTQNFGGLIWDLSLLFGLGRRRTLEYSWGLSKTPGGWPKPKLAAGLWNMCGLSDFREAPFGNGFKGKPRGKTTICIGGVGDSPKKTPVCGGRLDPWVSNLRRIWHALHQPIRRVMTCRVSLR